MAFPWRKNSKIMAEAKELNESLALYEDHAIFWFGIQIALHEDTSHIQLFFRPPNQFPDAILVREDTNEVMNIEFEAQSKNFQKHMHEYEKCDLIVALYHNEEWKNPIPVYEVTSGKIIDRKQT